MVKLIAVGDISLETESNTSPFRRVKKAFSDKDILFGNLETVLSNRGQKVEKSKLLYTSPKKVEYLKEAGFDILNLANNHIMDLGSEGFYETLEVLNHNGLSFIGAGNRKFSQPYKIIERKGIKFGFLGYHKGGFRDSKEGIFVNQADSDRIVADIKDLRSKCDVTVISLHWGIENVFYPSPEQIELARNLVDSGATVILGHHPHVVQGIEKYKNGLIAYSLGNFQFDTKHVGEINKKANESMIFSINIYRNGIEGYDVMPVKISYQYVPYILTGQEKNNFVEFISEISKPIGEGRITRKWWFEEIARAHIVGNMKSWVVRIKKYGIRHLLQCVKWLFSPFIMKCYLGLLRRKIRKYD